MASSKWFLVTFTVIASVFLSARVASSQGASHPRVRATANTPLHHNLEPKQPALQRRSSRYTVHPTDTLTLTFPLTPEFNQTVTVQPDGFVSLQGIGELSVVGQTLPELTASLTKAYSSILKKPMIYVDPTDYQKPYFVVLGQVGKPGKFEWRGGVTVTEAIAVAGGFTDGAKHSQVVLFRRISDQWAEGKVLNVKRMLNARNLAEDPTIEPGDMLYVPKNVLSKIKPFIPLPSIGMYANRL